MVKQTLFTYESKDLTSSAIDFQNFNNISDEAKMLGLLFGGVSVTKSSGEQILQNTNFFVFQDYNEEEKVFRDFRSVQAILQNMKEEYQDNPEFLKPEISKSITDLLNSFNSVLKEDDSKQKQDFDGFILNEFLLEEANKDKLNTYFSYMERQNKEFQSILLSELTMFFFKCERSPTTAFIHLYRILELLSFNIPLVYTSRETSYIGAFNKLKKFFGASGEEFTFFKNFLKTLFKDEDEVLKQDFVFIISSENLESVKIDLNAIYPLQKKEDMWFFEIKENNVAECRISFFNLIDLMVNIRNRYFHLNDGKGNPNIKNKNYDMDQVFYSLNFSILNYLAIILLSVSKHSFSNYTRFFETE